MRISTSFPATGVARMGPDATDLVVQESALE